MPIRTKVYTFSSQWELRAKRSKLLEARENMSDQVAIFFRFPSDWSRGWRNFFARPITERKTWLLLRLNWKLFQRVNMWLQVHLAWKYIPCLFFLRHVVKVDVRRASIVLQPFILCKESIRSYQTFLRLGFSFRN